MSPTLRRIDSRRWLLLALLTPTASAELAESLWQVGALPKSGDGFWACSGAYVDPAAANSAAALANDNEPVELTAQTARSLIGDITHVAGGVAVRQGPRRLTTAAIEIDERTAVARAAGAVRLGEPGLHMLGQRAVVGLRENNAQIEDAQFVLTGLEMHGQATRIDRQGTALQLDGASLTRCPPNRRTWQLQAKTMDLDQDKVFATARHVRLRLGRVPVFYSPYLRLPVSEERASGLLFPNIGYDDEDGADIALPYYLNLAPHYDATLTPRFIASRGTGLEAEFRHLGRRSRTELGGAFLGRDDSYNGELPRDDYLAGGGIARDFVPANRWLASANHQGRIGPLRTLVDYTAASDNDYFVDLGAELAISSRVLLERRGEIQYSRGGLFTRLWGQSFQRLEPGSAPYWRAPEFNLTYAGTVWGPLDWSLGASCRRFAAVRRRPLPAWRRWKAGAFTWNRVCGCRSRALGDFSRSRPARATPPTI